MADELRGTSSLEHLALVADRDGGRDRAGGARRHRWPRGVPAGGGLALGFANIMQTVPSLALFGFLIPIPFIGGIGKRTAIVALVLYALLPILRNTLAGILGVDRGGARIGGGHGDDARAGAVAGGDAAVRAHDPGRDPHRHGGHDRRGHHRGGHRRRRAGRIHLPRDCVGGYASRSWRARCRRR